MNDKYEHYIKSIDRRWKKEVKQAIDKIFVLSPYITSKTADIILNNVQNPAICEIYTVFSVDNFISGSSSIHTIKRLYEKGFNLYHLEKLHAKIILIPNQFASIGSQNLTYNGVRNKEASIVITDSLKIQEILERLEKWFLQRSIITENMINEMEDNFVPLRDKFFELQQEAAALDNSIWDNEYKRIQDFLVNIMVETFEIISDLLEMLNEELTELEKNKLKTQLINDDYLQKQLKTVKYEISRIEYYSNIEKSICEYCISQSAYWYNHRCGRPVHSPGDANKIEYNNQNGWIKKYGGNTFFVAKAISRCRPTILRLIKNLEDGDIFSFSLEYLIDRLKNNVRDSIANSNGYEYYRYSNVIESNHIKLGSHTINMKEFIEALLRKLSLYSFCLYIENHYKDNGYYDNDDY